MSNIEELRKYCDDNRQIIYVRAFHEGKWRSVTFDVLSPEDQESFIQKWLAEDKFPARVLES